jgi:putative two-component system response regulator
LVVDDEPLYCALFEAYLQPEGYTVTPAASGAAALDAVAAAPPDLILLDAMMPGIDGFAVCSRLKASAETRLIPIVMITALTAAADRLRAIEAGVDEFLSKPVNRVELLSRVRALLRAKRYADELESAESVVVALTRAIEARDGYTEEHTARVTRRAMALGARLGLSEDLLRILREGALLHDIGKIGIPEAILGKPGLLTEDEVRIMRRHPLIGVEICRPLHSYLVRAALPIIRHHHEAVDGSGYPDELAGDAIPLLARITAVSDAYDAMTSHRPYRHGMSGERALGILRAGAGSQWDAGLVGAFVELDQDMLAP